MLSQIRPPFNEKTGVGEVLTAKQALTVPAKVPALGLRAGDIDFFILPQTGPGMEMMSCLSAVTERNLAVRHDESDR